MTMPTISRHAVAVACLLAARTGGAQSPGPGLGAWAMAPFVGAARHSPAGDHWGTTPDRNHLFMGVHFATPVLRVGPLALQYAPNVVPLVVVSNNPRYTTVVTSGIPRKVESGRKPVFGAGLVPFGLQLEARAGRTASLYSMAALGGVWFSDYMPQDGARRFNFSIEFGGGLYLRANHAHAIQLGYKFHHLSNMYTARQNPGVDAHVVYAGLRWQSRRPARRPGD